MTLYQAVLKQLGKRVSSDLDFMHEHCSRLTHPKLRQAAELLGQAWNLIQEVIEEHQEEEQHHG